MIIALTILKIIGYLLLSLLTLVLLILCVILFCPLTYKALVSGKDARILAKWLAGLISFRWEYKDSKFRYHLGLPFSGIRRRKTAHKREKRETPQECPDIQNPDIPHKSAQTDSPEKSDEALTVSKPADTHTSKPKQTGEPEHKPPPPRNKKGKKENKKNKRENPVAVIVRLYKHPDRKPIVRNTKLLLRRLFRALKPKFLRVSGEIGLSNPYDTGRLFAALAALSPVTGSGLMLRARYDKEIIDMDVIIRGRLTLFSLTLPILIFAFTGPERGIIWKYIKNKDHENETEEKK